MKTWIVIDQHNHAFQLRCSTFAFCYVRIALLCSHYAEAKFLRLEFFEIVWVNIIGVRAFVREPYHCPFRGNDELYIRWGMLKRYGRNSWYHHERGRFCDLLLRAVLRRSCQLISRMMALILWVPVSFPLTLSLWGSNWFSKTSNHSDIANATDTKGRRFRHPAQSDG